MFDTGIMQHAVFHLCRGTFDIPTLRAKARRAQLGSPILYATLGARCRAVYGCRPRQARCLQATRHV
jgi:hypothetical protein